MWLIVPVAIFLALVYVGRQVRLGKWTSGPWFRQFRAVRSVIGLLCLAIGTMMMVRGLYLPGVACLVIAFILSGSVRISGTMNRQEPQAAASYTAEEIRAYQTLGLGIGADRKAVREAWKRLMKEAHPDQGGDPARATALNAARDVLLRRRG